MVPNHERVCFRVPQQRFPHTRVLGKRRFFRVCVSPAAR
uniref:Uncharacterized protein n=1 Tax=Arundo donax TaxID=35708 RepID=A0A0A9EQ21_ARUDO